jgi:hypothetical protein
VILLILGWIFSMVFVIGSAATGDFCYGSPDENVVVRLWVVALLVVGSLSDCTSSGAVESERTPIQPEHVSSACFLCLWLPDKHYRCGSSTAGNA